MTKNIQAESKEILEEKRSEAKSEEKKSSCGCGCGCIPPMKTKK